MKFLLHRSRRSGEKEKILIFCFAHNQGTRFSFYFINNRNLDFAIISYFMTLWCVLRESFEIQAPRAWSWTCDLSIGSKFHHKALCSFSGPRKRAATYRVVHSPECQGRHKLRQRVDIIDGSFKISKNSRSSRASGTQTASVCRSIVKNDEKKYHYQASWDNGEICQ